MTPLTERQKTLIVNNVIKAVKNIDNLNKTGYNFLYLASGFIASYTGQSLKQDIISFAGSNQWNNFRPGERDYDYYMAKKDVYNRILQAIV